MSTTNNRTSHSQKNVFPNQTNLGENHHPHSEVWQDKDAPIPGRGASDQPALVTKSTRAQQPGSKGTRSQTSLKGSEKAVKVTAWIKPIMKAELERIAEQERLSLSATCAASLEKSVHQNLHLQHAVLLQPMIHQAIAREMRTISTRLAWLLVWVAFDAGQTRSMVTNILGRQPGVTPNILQTILEGSGKTAKANITRRTPQLTELIEAVEKWVLVGDEEEQERSN